MKKLFGLIAILFMSLVSLTGCNEIHKGNLETIDVASYVKEEETSKLTGGKVFFCIFGSYTHTKTSVVVQRYIFLAQNGSRNSYKINDVHVGIKDPIDPEYTNHVYFKYIEEGETPYLEYQDNHKLDEHACDCWEHNYWLYLPRTAVLEIARDMFKDI